MSNVYHTCTEYLPGVVKPELVTITPVESPDFFVTVPCPNEHRPGSVYRHSHWHSESSKYLFAEYMRSWHNITADKVNLREQLVLA